jgi:hypothetical protein
MSPSFRKDATERDKNTDESDGDGQRVPKANMAKPKHASHDNQNDTCYD